MFVHNPLRPRYRHGAIVSGGIMYVYGGTEGPTRLNDIQHYTFSLHMAASDRVTQIDQIPSLVQHRCIAYNGDMYIYGGDDTTDKVNTLYKYVISLFFSSLLSLTHTLLLLSLSHSHVHSTGIPSSLVENITSHLSSHYDSQIFTYTHAYPTNRCLIRARFPILLPYLLPLSPSSSSSSSSSSLPSDHSGAAAAASPSSLPLPSTPKLPLTDGAAEALLDYIASDKLDADELSLPDVSSLLAFAEDSGSVKLKTICVRMFEAADLGDLNNLGETLVVAHKFKMQHLERFLLVFFDLLHPLFLVTILILLTTLQESTSLLHFTPSLYSLPAPSSSYRYTRSSLVVGRLSVRQDDGNGLDSVWTIMDGKEEHVKQLLEELKVLTAPCTG